MRRRVGFYLVILFLVGVISACSNQQEVIEETTPAFLDVQLSINPEHGQVNEPVTFQAKVTYGEKVVTEADTVEFEIWRSQEDDHEKVEVEHKENGIYELEKDFSEEGTYYIVAHVTAENMHNMPKKEFIIGEPSEPEE